MGSKAGHTETQTKTTTTTTTTGNNVVLITDCTCAAHVTDACREYDFMGIAQLGNGI